MEPTDKRALMPQRVLVSELAEDPAIAIESMALVPMELPDEATLGPREVLIEVRAAAVGWVDLIMASGQYQHVPAPPYTPGLEFAGVVVAAGHEACAVMGPGRLGREVLVDGLLAGPRSVGAYQRAGGFATHAVVPVEALRALPPGLTCDEAVSFFGSYETAYHCLVTRGGLAAGETVLVHGASGSTGLAAVHIAKVIGATVIATGRSDEKLAVVRAQGADVVINCRPVEEGTTVRRFRDEVKAMTGGAGVDVVYDGVGGDISLESLRCMKFGARFLVVGWAATPNVAHGRGLRGAPNANQLPTNLIMMKGLTVMGCPMAIATLSDPSIRAPRVEALMGWVQAGRLRPHISHRFALADFKDALRAKWRGDVIGACVLHP